MLSTRGARARGREAARSASQGAPPQPLWTGVRKGRSTHMEITLYIGVLACLGVSLLLLPKTSGGIAVKARSARELDRVMSPRLLFSNTRAPVARC